MTFEEKKKIIIDNNKELLKKVIIYITSTYNITTTKLLDNTKYYVSSILKDIRDNNYKLLRLRQKKDNISKDLDDLNKAYTRGDSYDDVQSGKQKGGLQKNTVEERQLKKQNLKEKLRVAIYQVLELEASLEENNRLIESFIDLIPNAEYKHVMKQTYISCQSNGEIAISLFYEVETVNSARKRSVNILTDLISTQAKKLNAPKSTD